MNNIREDIDHISNKLKIIPLTDDIMVEIGAIISGAFHEMMANDHEKLYKRVQQWRAKAFSGLEIVESLVQLLKSLVISERLAKDAKVLSNMEMLLTKIMVKERNELRYLKREQEKMEKDGIARSIKNLTQAGIEEVLYPLDEESPSGRAEMPTLTEDDFVNEMRIDEEDRITELPTLSEFDKPTRQPSVPPEEFARRINKNFEEKTNSGYSLQAPKLPIFRYYK